MSTVTTTQQIHLVNIISVAQDKLQSNFTMILNRLRDHDRLIAENAQTIQILSNKNSQKIDENRKESEDRFMKVYENIRNLEQKLTIEGDKIKLNNNGIEQMKSEIQIINERWENNKLELDEQFQIKNNEIYDLNQRASQITNRCDQLQSNLLTKENITEVEKVIKEISEIKQKNHIVDSDIKLVQHKMEKMEIMTQKAERMQAKKDAQLLKEIQQKIKKQTKGIYKSSTPQRTNSRQSAYSPIGQRVKLQNTMSFKLEEEEMEKQLRTSSVNVEKNLSHISQKVSSMEFHMKQVQEFMKYMKEKNKKSMHSTGEGLQEKLNELKTQMIKLWAKHDALDDRIAFTDRKMQEKGKIINNLVESQRQNSWAKMQDKLKTFQTEMYTFIKEIKVKVEGKIGSQDYEKHNQLIDNKIKQINEQIFLKSDKLQVKKALLFLQSKIKEIILVISEDQQNEKDALLTKKQLKCISCDKDVQKMSGCSNTRGNWDNLPFRDHAPEVLGRFGMTNYGSLAKKLKKLENQDLPILSKKNKQNQNNNPKSP